jgi:phosphatidylserine/phosphatidylglycerophosphate/cardiolipin synthase-like enzyme/uncharacterized membrane protein YdjX (TVP38/TMEM64 family)
LIIDGEDYFRALRDALSNARSSVFILGWDIHSELRLVRDDADDGFPAELGPCLDELARRRPDVIIHVLSWDFSMIYTMEREFFPTYKLRWKSHDRVRFCLDSEHPVGGSQHQKLVVIDDRLAFCGGIDLGKWRWDTPRHLVDDDRRIDPDGKPYPPFHDMQMVVDGEAARALGELARERWRAAADDPPAPVKKDVDVALWPSLVEPDFTSIDLGIARTIPAYEGREEIREVEALYLDSIQAAERFIYIENQYLSSHAIGQALARKLEEHEGPEVIIVGPEQTGGWLEQHTMDVLRGRLLRNLRAADQYDRLRVYFVKLAEDPHTALMIHAKLMIVDDRILRVGSSNLSNRSMGLDSECDLAIDAGANDASIRSIRTIRHRLLGEHLAVEPETLRNAETRHSSILAAVESLRGGVHTLEPLAAEVPEDVDEWVPDSELIDPEQPIEPDALIDYFVGSRDRKSGGNGLLGIGALLIAVIALAAAWRWTPLGDFLTLDGLESVGEWLRDRPLTPLFVIAAYVVAGFAIVPVTLLFAATVAVFGPWLGMAYGLVGAELSALACFGAGHALGRGAVRRFAGSRVNRISRRLSERGVLTIITLRIIPVAPFSVVNFIAGISDIRFRDFAIGNLLGMLPGIVGIALVTDRALALVRDPSPTTIVVAALVLVVAAGALAITRRWLKRRNTAAS